MTTFLNPVHLPSFVENVLNKNWNEVFTPTTVPSVNVLENENGFKVEVAAPGLSKEDFKINLASNVLTISAKKEQKNEESSEKYTRKEFSFSSFQRAFTLPNTISTDKIQANYTDGILKVELPKKEETKTNALRQIEVA